MICSRQHSTHVEVCLELVRADLLEKEKAEKAKKAKQEKK